MALCRCLKHPPQGRKYRYEYYVLPIGYINTSSICGRIGCNNQGLIWLNQEETNCFNNNRARIFEFPNAASKVKVQNEIVEYL